jgi:hypothetical protein
MSHDLNLTFSPFIQNVVLLLDPSELHAFELGKKMNKSNTGTGTPTPITTTIMKNNNNNNIKLTSKLSPLVVVPTQSQKNVKSHKQQNNINKDQFRLNNSHDNIMDDIDNEYIGEYKDEDETLKIDRFFPLEMGRNILNSIEKKGYISAWDQSDIQTKLTLQFLVENKFTLNRLLTVFAVPISELKIKKIVTRIADLQALQFHPTDLAIRRELFNVNHLHDLFNSNYNTLIEAGVVFGLKQLDECQFNYSELLALKFTFNKCFDKYLIPLLDDTKIPEDAKNYAKMAWKKHLFGLRLNRHQLQQLGFETKHIKILDIKNAEYIANWT